MITVIIPAYNEEGNISRIEEELIPVMVGLNETYEIIIIDDGSLDNTVNETKKIIKRDKHIRLVKHGKNKGLGSAIITGILHARGDKTIILDADFTFHPREISKLLDVYNKGGYDFVIGSPFARGGRTKDIAFFRIVMSRAVSLLYSLVSKSKR